MIKKQLITLVETALTAWQETEKKSEILLPAVQIDRTKDASHGDYATNIALMLAKPAKAAPRQIAEQLQTHFVSSDLIEKIEIAGPGFINFYLSAHAKQKVVADVLLAKENFGRSELGQNQRVHLEYVSANPTGPLHVGHGRSAAFGASLTNLLRFAGFDVHGEYYVNDAGRQMDILATSVWLRYIELFGDALTFPSNGYRGDYIIPIANAFKQQVDKQFYQPLDTIFSDLPDDEPQGGDKEQYIDALVARAKKLLGDENYETVHQFGLQAILSDIRDDLEDFGVVHQEWFSEKSLIKSGAVENAIAQLKADDCLYEREGAVWFNASRYNDEKDRVLIRSNGTKTYFATDVAYHYDKYERGFDHVIDIFGADHHGYVVRIKASVDALGKSSENFTILLVQFAILYRGKEKVQMSTRSGQFVTLRELREEVGNDAARYFYVARKAEQHMDFDLDLAKSKSNENPVYYIQYAHARICSVFRQLKEKDLQWDEAKGNSHLSLLTSTHEQAVLTVLARFPELIEVAAVNYEPHQIAHYLRDLAQAFHTYYNAEQFIVDDEATRQARLCLVMAVKTVLQNGLKLIGVSAPEEM